MGGFFKGVPETLKMELNRQFFTRQSTVALFLTFKGSDRQSEVVELSMQSCAQIL